MKHVYRCPQCHKPYKVTAHEQHRCPTCKVALLPAPFFCAQCRKVFKFQEIGKASCPACGGPLKPFLPKRQRSKTITCAQPKRTKTQSHRRPPLITKEMRMRGSTATFAMTSRSPADPQKSSLASPVPEDNLVDGTVQSAPTTTPSDQAVEQDTAGKSSGQPTQQEGAADAFLSEPASQSVQQDTVAWQSRAAAKPSSAFKLHFTKYELLEEIGRGGMGIVYKARHKGTGRILALKTLTPGENVSAEMIERFKREARAAANLIHPNVVQVHDVGCENEIHYLTMDFIEGRSLEDLLEEQHLSLEQGIEIIKQIAEGLHYAHEHGIVHRDVKPANVLVSADQVAHIMDFGIAKNISEDIHITRTGVVMGTPSYMAPEQSRGIIKEIDRQSDVFSLGIILYRHLTGQLPFTGSTVLQVLHAVAATDPIAPSKLNPQISQDMESVCLKALEKDKQQRYQTAQELAQELDRLLKGEAVVAKPLTLPKIIWRKIKRRKSLWGVVAAAVVLLTVTMVIYSYKIHYLQEQLVDRQAQQLSAQLYRDACLAFNQGNFAKVVELLSKTQVKLERQGHALLGLAYARQPGQTNTTKALKHLRQALQYPWPRSSTQHSSVMRLPPISSHEYQRCLLPFITAFERLKDYQQALQVIKDAESIQQLSRKQKKTLFSPTLMAELTFHKAQLYYHRRLLFNCIHLCTEYLQKRSAQSSSPTRTYLKWYRLRAQAQQLHGAQLAAQHKEQQARRSYSQAASDFTTCLLMSGEGKADLYAGRGQVQLRLQRYPQALQDYAAACWYASARNRTRLLQLWRQCSEQWYRHVGDQYTQWLQEQPKPEYFYQRGQLYLAQGHRQEAIADLAACTKLAPRSPLVTLFQAQLALSAGHYQQVASYCQKLEGSSQADRALLLYAQAALQSEQFDLAHDLIERGQAQDSRNYQWYVLQGRLYFAQRDYPLAVVALSIAIALVEQENIWQPPLARLAAYHPYWAYYYRGRSLLALEQELLKAQNDFRQCSLLRPLAVEPYYWEAVGLIHQGRQEEALPFYQEHLTGLSGAATYVYKARLYQKLHQFDAAIKSYRQGLAKYPQNPRVWQGLLQLLWWRAAPGWAACMQRLARQAMQEPRLAELYLQTCYRQMCARPGDHKAREQFQQALQKFPQPRFDYFRGLWQNSQGLTEQGQRYFRNIQVRHWRLHAQLVQRSRPAKHAAGTPSEQPSVVMVKRLLDQAAALPACQMANKLLTQARAGASGASSSRGLLLLYYLQGLWMQQQWQRMAQVQQTWQAQLPEVCRWGKWALRIGQGQLKSVTPARLQSKGAYDYAFRWLKLQYYLRQRAPETLLAAVPDLVSLPRPGAPWRIMARPLRTRACYAYLAALTKRHKQSLLDAFWRACQGSGSLDLGLKLLRVQYNLRRQNYQQAYQQAMALYRQGVRPPIILACLGQACYHLERYEQALVFFRQELRAPAPVGEPRLYMAWCHLKLGQPRQALKMLAESVRQDSQYVPALRLLLELLLRERPLPHDKIVLYLKSFSLGESYNCDRTYYRTFYQSLNTGADNPSEPANASMALKIWTAYLRQYPADYRGYSARAACYLQHGDLQAAHRDLLQMKARLPLPLQYQADLRLGSLYLQTNPSKAIARLQMARQHSLRAALMLYRLYTKRGAREECQRLWYELAQHPRLLDKAQLITGKYLFRHKRFHQAWQVFVKMPHERRALWYQALILRQFGDVHGALRNIETLLKTHPENAYFHTLHGLLCEECVKKATAISSYQRAIQLDQQYLPAYLLLADLHYRLGHAVPALKVLARAYDLAEHSPLVIFNLASLYLKTRQYEKAHVVLQEYPQNLRSQTAYQNNLAVWEAIQGNTSEARRILANILEKEPTNFTAAVNHGLLLLQNKQFETAIQHFHHLVKTTTQPSLALSLLAYSKLLAYKWKLQAGPPDSNAKQSYQQELNQEQLALQRIINMALVHEDRCCVKYIVQALYDLQCQKNVQAARVYQTALQECGYHPDILHNLGILYYQLHQGSKAMACFQKLHDLCGPKSRYEFFLGLLALEAGNSVKGIQYLEQAIQKDPSLAYIKKTDFFRK